LRYKTCLTSVFDDSHFFSNLVAGHAPLANFIVDGHEYTMGYPATLLPDVDDGIYPNNHPNIFSTT